MTTSDEIAKDLLAQWHLIMAEATAEIEATAHNEAVLQGTRVMTMLAIGLGIVARSGDKPGEALAALADEVMNAARSETKVPHRH